MNVESPSRRLRWARAHHGKYKTPTDAARAFGWPVSTYLGHENGDRVPSRAAARRYAAAFRVRWEWLLEGEGAPAEKPTKCRIIGEIEPFGEIKFYPKDKIKNTAELPPGVTTSTVAVEVRGPAMPGIADDEWLIFFDGERRPPTSELVGKLCVVEIDTGEILVRKLQPGRKKGCYDLELLATPTLRDRRVVWAARVSWIKPR